MWDGCVHCCQSESTAKALPAKSANVTVVEYNILLWRSCGECEIETMQQRGNVIYIVQEPIHGSGIKALRR
jgi:hypothetical protein